MKILMTNHGLRLRGGSELFVAETAVAMCRSGHEICVFTTAPGEVSAHLEAGGISIVSDPAACPFVPDMIHGQHHLETMAALAAWPAVQGVYFIHGAAPWDERPPCHPRLVRYLSTAPRMGSWPVHECGITAADFVVIRNFFDSNRFLSVRDFSRRTGKALVFHNTMRPEGPAHRALLKACAAVGLTLEAVGHAFGRMVTAPESLLPDYDVVFAAGRSAIEAMACGCTVLPVTAEQAEARVHPGNYAEFADRNFTAEMDAPPVDASIVTAELRRIRMEETAEVTRRIRTEATLEAAVKGLLACYESVLATPPKPWDPEAEQRAVARYLLTLSTKVREVDERRAKLAEDRDRAAQRAAKWKHQAKCREEHLSWLENRFSTGNWLLRRKWRQWRREWEIRTGE